MKIIRKEFKGNEVVKTVVSNKATNQTWRYLVEKCRDKCNWSHYGIPYMTVWKNKVSLETKNGHSFEFQLIK